MTKLVQLRITIAVDDQVDMRDVKQRLHAGVVDLGTETIHSDGETPKRIHWSTAEVLQGPERVPQRRGGGRRAKTPEGIGL